MGTKVKFQPTKTKLKYDAKAGDKIKFLPVSKEEYNSILNLVESNSYEPKSISV